MISKYWLILIILTTVAFFSVKASKLTVPAAIAGWFVGLLIFCGTGYAGVAMITVFFILATGATSWGMSVKQRLGLAEHNKGKRTAGQVIANAGVATTLSILAMFFDTKADLFVLMITAAIASATADTLSSEMGNIYGKNFYNIITFKKDTRGLNGVISIEGTIIGILGSAGIAAVYGCFFGISSRFLLIIIAGTIGNLSDSVFGATLERKGYLNNNQVNFINTAIAALFILFIVFRKY